MRELIAALPKSGYVSLGIAVGIALAMCSVPLFGIQGAESALLLGIVLPPLAAYTAARLIERIARPNDGGL
ncbi:MAG TPA: hypothetical protein VHZ95_10475, partial [Polyangiales bacterium]|nr:hypothetical protein [Polyangiales bacterium]